MPDIKISLKVEKDEATKSIKDLQSEWQEANQKVEDYKKTISSLESQIDKITSKIKQDLSKFFGNNAIAVENAFKKLENVELKKLTSQLEEAKDNLSKATAEADKLENKINELNKQPSKISGIPNIKQEVKEQLYTIKPLYDYMSKIPTALVSQFKSLDFKQVFNNIGNNATQAFSMLSKIPVSLSAQFKNLGNVLSTPFRAVGDMVSNIGDKIQQVGNRILKLATYTFVFNVITIGFRQIRAAAEDYINSNEALNSSLARIRGNLLSAFQPLWETILPYLIQFIGLIEKATAYISAFMSALFGKSEQASRNNARQLQSQIQASKNASTALEKQKKNTDKLKKSTDDSNKSLAKFDQLNVLLQPKKQATTPSKDIKIPTATVGDIKATGISFDSPKIDTSGIQAFVEKAKDFLRPITDVLTNELFPQLDRLKGYTLEAFGDFYNTFLKPLSTYVVSEALPHLLNTMATTLSKMDFSQLNEGLHNLFSALEPITEELIRGCISFFDNFLAPLSTYIVNTALPTFLNNTAEALKKMDFSKVNEGLSKLFANIEKFTEKALAGFNWLWVKILLPMSTYTVNTAIPKFLDSINIGLDALNGLMDKILPQLDELYEEYLKPIGDMLKKEINAGLDQVNDLMKDFKNQVTDENSELNKMLPTLKDFIGQISKLGATELAHNIKFFFGAITTGTRVLVKAIDVAYRILKPYVELMYALSQRDWRKAGFSIVDLSRALSGAKWNSEEIPRLASGAVIPPNSPFLAMLGDQKNGTNIEAPLETIKQAFVEALSENGNNYGNNYGDNSYTFVAQLDGRTLFEETIRQNDMYKYQAGYSAFA